MPEVVTAPRPVASDFNGDQRRAMLAWLDANGIPNYRVTMVELLNIDAPMVAATRKVTDSDGRSLVNPLTREILTETTDHLVRVPPPEFWQPQPVA